MKKFNEPKIEQPTEEQRESETKPIVFYLSLKRGSGSTLSVDEFNQQDSGEHENDKWQRADWVKITTDSEEYKQRLIALSVKLGEITDPQQRADIEEEMSNILKRSEIKTEYLEPTRRHWHRQDT